MPSVTESKRGNGLTPCRLSMESWPVCYADGCYLNRRCPVYRGTRPSPERDYLPAPAVFLLLGPYEAVPVSYHVPVCVSDGE